jgi:type II secretion system (T2SS) protein G
MRRAAFMGVRVGLVALAAFVGLAAVPGCSVNNDARYKEHVATAHADVARLRATAEGFVKKNGRCPGAGEFPRVADPWGSAYVVICPGQNGHAADVVSRGVDGDIGTRDDVRSWE